MTLCDNVVCGLLRSPWLVDIKSENFNQVFQLLVQPPSHYLPWGLHRNFYPVTSSVSPSCFTIIDGHSRTLSQKQGLAWVHVGWEAPWLSTCWKGKSWSLLHDQAVFSNWARAFIILHQLWTLNRREKVGHFRTGFPLCQQSAIILTSFVWYKWEGDKCRVPARVY